MGPLKGLYREKKRESERVNGGTTSVCPCICLEASPKLPSRACFCPACFCLSCVCGKQKWILLIVVFLLKKKKEKWSEELSHLRFLRYFNMMIISTGNTRIRSSAFAGASFYSNPLTRSPACRTALTHTWSRKRHGSVCSSEKYGHLATQRYTEDV